MPAAQPLNIQLSQLLPLAPRSGSKATNRVCPSRAATPAITVCPRAIALAIASTLCACGVPARLPQSLLAPWWRVRLLQLPHAVGRGGPSAAPQTLPPPAKPTRATAFPHRCPAMCHTVAPTPQRLDAAVPRAHADGAQARLCAPIWRAKGRKTAQCSARTLTARTRRAPGRAPTWCRTSASRLAASRTSRWSAWGLLSK